MAEIEAHSSGIKKVAVSPVTGDILSAAYDQRILIWDAADLRQKLQLESRLGTWERSFNWSPDGRIRPGGHIRRHRARVGRRHRADACARSAAPGATPA